MDSSYGGSPSAGAADNRKAAYMPCRPHTGNAGHAGGVPCRSARPGGEGKVPGRLRDVLQARLAGKRYVSGICRVACEWPGGLFPVPCVGGRGACRAGRGILVFLRQGDGRRCAGESDLWAARMREGAYGRALRKEAKPAGNRGKSSGGTGEGIKKRRPGGRRRSGVCCVYAFFSGRKEARMPRARKPTTTLREIMAGRWMTPVTSSSILMPMKARMAMTDFSRWRR